MSGTGWSGKVGYTVGKAIAGGGKTAAEKAAAKAASVAAKAAFLKAHGFLPPAAKAATVAKPLIVKVAIGIGKVVLTAAVGIISALVCSSNG